MRGKFTFNGKFSTHYTDFKDLTLLFFFGETTSDCLSVPKLRHIKWTDFLREGIQQFLNTKDYKPMDFKAYLHSLFIHCSFTEETTVSSVHNKPRSYYFLEGPVLSWVELEWAEK